MNTGKYKNKILDCFKRGHLLSAEDVAKEIKGANFSTIYRNIINMVDKNVLKKIVIDRQNVKYELNERNGHDHIICNDCGTIEEIIVEKEKIINKTKGFSVSDALFRGRCKNCKFK